MNIEEKAKEMGHISKEDWRGDPDKWRPAEDFIKRGEEMIPILKDRLDKTEKELRSALEMNKQEIEEAKKMAYDAAMRDFNRQKSDLEAKELKAFQEGDEEAYKTVKKEQKDLKPPDEPKKPQDNPVFVEWREKHPWYQSDSELAEYADHIGQYIARRHNGKPLMEIYEKVAEEVKLRFPEKFENKRRKESSHVEGASPSASGSGKQDFSSLPDSAKKAYEKQAEKFAKQGRKLTKEAYVSAYYE